MRRPLTTSRTAWARRNTRASLVCFKNVSKVGRASSGKWSLRVRMMGVSRKNYYKNSFGTWLVLSEQSLFDSNFPGAANLRHRRLRKRLSIFLAIRVGYTTRVKIPAASGGALEGRSLLCWGNLSPKPPNKDAIPPHRKQWGILASFRDEWKSKCQGAA